jgi:hypothetical protein
LGERVRVRGCPAPEFPMRNPLTLALSPKGARG